MDAQLLTDVERKAMRSKIYREAGNTRAPDHAQRFYDSVTNNWRASPLYTLLSRGEFQYMVLSFHKSKKSAKRHPKPPEEEHKTPPVIIDNEQNRVVFIQLCRSVADKCNRLPDDCIMNAFAKTLGYVETIWNTTKRAMKDQGYTFAPVENGYIVDHADKIRINEIQQEMERLQNELKVLTKKSPAKS